MNRRYEQLKSLPTYGPMYIPVSDNDEPFYSEGLVIRFFRTDETDWVANFKPGWTDLNLLYELEFGYLLVIAGGICYIMLPDEKKPVEVFGFNYREALYASDGRIILQDSIRLTIIEKNGVYWDSERISWDGFKNLSMEGDIVMGLSCDPTNGADEWKPFTYDINTQKITGGSF
jgi:hypothetical protein